MKLKIITLDVREDLHAGREPFSKIMNTAAEVQVDQSLRLIAPFEPVPLFAVLGRQGFQHTASVNVAGDWEVLFTRQSSGAPPGVESLPPQSVGSLEAGVPPSVIELDVRGLEPPQPLVAILEALGALANHAELSARTDRRPMHLYAELAARGFTGESQEQSDGSFLTHIRRH